MEEKYGKKLTPKQVRQIQHGNFSGAGINVSAKKQRELMHKPGMLENYISDYELYQLLEMEGYETTNENLEILKEGLYTGEIELN